MPARSSAGSPTCTDTQPSSAAVRAQGPSRRAVSRPRGQVGARAASQAMADQSKLVTTTWSTGKSAAARFCARQPRRSPDRARAGFDFQIETEAQAPQRRQDGVQARDRGAGEGATEPSAGVGPGELCPGRPAHRPAAVGGPVESVVMHQIATSSAVSLTSSSTQRTPARRRRQTGKGVFRRHPRAPRWPMSGGRVNSIAMPFKKEGPNGPSPVCVLDAGFSLPGAVARANGAAIRSPAVLQAPNLRRFPD